MFCPHTTCPLQAAKHTCTGPPCKKVVLKIDKIDELVQNMWSPIKIRKILGTTERVCDAKRKAGSSMSFSDLLGDVVYHLHHLHGKRTGMQSVADQSAGMQDEFDLSEMPVDLDACSRRVVRGFFKRSISFVMLKRNKFGGLAFGMF